MKIIIAAIVCIVSVSSSLAQESKIFDGNWKLNMCSGGMCIRHTLSVNGAEGVFKRLASQFHSACVGIDQKAKITTLDNNEVLVEIEKNPLGCGGNKFQLKKMKEKEYEGRGTNSSGQTGTISATLE